MRRVISVTWQQLLFITAMFGLTVYMFKKNECSPTVSSSQSQEENSNRDLFRDHFDESERLDELFSPDKDREEEYESVDTLLLFVGYPRSRHTLLASLLDGHPHMVLANEKNLFYRLKNGEEYERKEMFDMLVESSRGFLEKGGKGMVLNGSLENSSHFGFWMKGYWQGTYDKYIKVIGDKTAWYTSTSFRYMTNDEITSLVDKMEKKYSVRVKFIHIIRNPFDIVSTITLRNTKQQGGRFADHTEKVDDPELLQKSIMRFGYWAEGSEIARKILGDKVLDVNGLELVQKPVETMATICQFIGITCSEEYLQACAKVVDPKPSITRHYVVWGQKQLDRVYSLINRYSFLAQYTFED
ncbi:uncharacterized protein LOC144644055 isoform X2 [Oculina patagonica]